MAVKHLNPKIICFLMSKKSSVRGFYSTCTTKLTTLQSKHSQSALEYMMTYGWAILIIVIVAAGLYSLGIFSPTNSASTSITGFSGLGSVQAECIGNQGLSMQIGNGLGYPIQLLNISVTGSGTTSSLQIQQTVSPNQYSQLYIPDICPSPSSRYSLSVTVFYTEPGQAFPGPYQSTGTIQGTPSTQSLSSSAVLISDVPITLTNNQNTSTPNPFQQMVTLPASVYSGYANLSGIHSFQNVEFFYSNGTIIPSWLENYTNNNALWWLKVASILPSSSITVYVGFASFSTNLFNTNNVGESPTLSSTFGEYDDGINVFNNYWNFAGTSIPTGWQNQTCKCHINNGAYVYDASWGGIITSSTYDFSTHAYLIGFYLNTTGNGDMALGTESGSSVAGGGNPYTLSTGSIRPAVAIGGTLNKTTYFYGWGNSSGNYITNLQTGLKYSDVDYEGIIEAGRLGSSAPGVLAYISVFAIINLPRAGLFPSVSFGQPSTVAKPSNTNILYYLPITITNNQNTSVSIFQQMLNIPSSVYSGYANLSGIHSFQNVEFFYSNGSVIHSWIENYTSSNVRYWIKIPSAPSYSSFTIYVGFASKTTNLLNTNNIGEAPQLSGTYGEYDDGANVFNVYSDFAGTSLPSSFTSYNGSNAYFSVNNCLQLQVNNAGCTGTWAGVIYDNSMDSTNSIVETYGSGTRSNGPDDVGVYTANSASGGGYAGVANGWGWGHGSIGGGYVGLGNPFDISSGSGVASIYWIGQGDEGIGWNYNFVSSTDTSMTWNSNLFASIQTGQCSPGADMNYYWFRIRTYPPNGVMPSISFGNVQ